MGDPLIDIRTGAVVDSASLTEDQIRSGRYAARATGDTIAVRSRVTGRVEEVDPRTEEGRALLESGELTGVAAPTLEEARSEQRAEEGQVETGVLSAANAALMGAPVGLGMLSERQEENMRRNTEARALGELAGTTAGLLAGGGAASAGMRALGAGARGAGLGVRSAQLANRGLMRTLGGQAARNAVRGGVEGAAIGAQQIITESALDDRELTGDALLSAMGTGALYGAGGEAVAGLGLGALGAAGRRATARLPSPSQVADSAVDLLERTMDGTPITGRAREAMKRRFRQAAEAGDISAAEADAIDTILSDTVQGRELLRRAQRPDEYLEEAVGSMADDLTIAGRSFDAVSNDATGGLKRRHVARVIRDDNALEQLAHAEELATENWMATQRILDDRREGIIEGRGLVGARDLNRQAQTTAERINALRRQASSGDAAVRREAAAEAAVLVDRLKRSTGRAQRRARSNNDVQELLRDAYEPLRQGLERADIYGEGFASNIQRRANQIWTDNLTYRNDVERMLLTGGDRSTIDAFERVMQGDTRGIAQVIRGVNRIEGRTGREAVERWLQSEADLLGQFPKLFEMEGAAAIAGREGAEAVERALATLRRAGGEIAEVDNLVNANRILGENLGAGARAVEAAAPFMGAGIGGAIGGFGGAGAGGLAGRSVGGFARAMTQPIETARALALMDRVTKQFRGSIGNAASRLVGKSPRNAVRNVLQRSEKAARRVGDVATAARGAALGTLYREKVNEILDASANAESIEGRVGPMARSLEGASPAVAGAMTASAQRGAAYLKGEIPGGTMAPSGLVPGRGAPRVSETEMRRFLSKVGAVQDPLGVIEDLAEGKIDPSAVEALRTVYPSVFAQLQRDVMRELTEGDADPGYQDRIRLGLLLDIPSDPSLEPQMLAGLQSHFSADIAPPGGPGLLSPSQDAPDIAKTEASGALGLEARRSGLA